MEIHVRQPRMMMPLCESQEQPFSLDAAAVPEESGDERRAECGQTCMSAFASYTSALFVGSSHNSSIARSGVETTISPGLEPSATRS